MFSSKVCAFLLVLLPAALSAVLTVDQIQKYQKNGNSGSSGIGINADATEVLLYYDTGLRNYDNSQAFCQEVDSQSDLAVIQSKQQYTSIRVDRNIPAGTYWINGQEKRSELQYTLSQSCDVKQDLTGVDVRSTSGAPQCLALIKGTSLTNTYLQVLPCTSNNRVLCQLPTTCTPPAEGGEGGGE